MSNDDDNSDDEYDDEEEVQVIDGQKIYEQTGNLGLSKLQSDRTGFPNLSSREPLGFL